MATFEGSKANNRPFLRLVATQTSQEVNNNRSRLNLKLYLVSPYRISAGGRSRSGNLQGSSFTSSKAFNGTNINTIIAERNIWVNHNSDGTKTVSLSASFNLGITWSGGINLSNISVSGSMKLTDIPRESILNSASLSEALLIGRANALNITRTKYYSGYDEQLSIWDGGTAIHYFPLATGTLPGSNALTDDIQKKLLNRMGNVTSKTFTIRLSTYSGGSRIGYTTRNLNMNVSANEKPVITSTSISEYISGLASQFNAYVQDKSRLKLEMNATAGYGASIRSYRMVASGTTYTSRTGTTNTLKNSGSQTVTFEATDSRGRKGTATTTINVLPYEPPKITKLTADRATSSGTANDEGTHGLIAYAMSISPLNNKNTKKFVLKYRRNGTNTWQTITLANSNYSYDTSRVIGPLNIDYAFDVQLVIQDYFTEVEVTEIVQSTFTLINFANNKRGISFGRTYNDELGGLLQAEGGLVPYFTEFEEV